MNTGFDEFFARASRALGLESQQALARELGVNRSAITQAKRKGFVPETWVFRLARNYGLNVSWLETGTGPMRENEARDEYCQVPKVRARLSAGGGSLDTDGDVLGYAAFASPWLRRKGRPEDMVLMDVVGNSMESEIKDGDTVLIDQGRKDIMAGAVYAMGVEDTVLVKRVEKRPGKLVLISDNPDYSPIELMGDEIEAVRVIGRVIWVSRELV